MGRTTTLFKPSSSVAAATVVLGAVVFRVVGVVRLRIVGGTVCTVVAVAAVHWCAPTSALEAGTVTAVPSLVTSVALIAGVLLVLLLPVTWVLGLLLGRLLLLLSPC